MKIFGARPHQGYAEREVASLEFYGCMDSEHRLTRIVPKAVWTVSRVDEGRPWSC